MKKTITISVDTDAWSRAKEKVPNLSKYVNDCLIGLAGKTLDERTKEQLDAEIKSYRATIEELSMKETIAQEAIRSIKETQLMKAKQELDDEQYNRWVCPVCKKQNFMDAIRCNGCNLPTRNETKTEVISIKGD